MYCGRMLEIAFRYPVSNLKCQLKEAADATAMDPLFAGTNQSRSKVQPLSPLTLKKQPDYYQSQSLCHRWC